MSVEPQRLSVSTYVIGIATALMVALAAGAVWCVLQLYLRVDLIGGALVVAVFIAWIVRRQGFSRTVSGALIAAISTAIACTYASFLLAAAQVASFVGEPMRSTLLKIGPALAADVAWAGMGAFQIGTQLLAIALSAWLVWRKA
ncbi:MAG TPA: hypothetical protein VFN25_01090 [Dokdonella sp.]|uniref:hypothetical protein n=1 Tax=Dokdonella sp. TaxID=2291710 RepID=UPI002D7FD329|nr:hypothetical protein [Dokdonella sp.]HET9031476.1 hypothetical protein [Dokdonella sp.]